MTTKRWLLTVAALVVAASIGYWICRAGSDRVPPSGEGGRLTENGPIGARYDCPDHLGVRILSPSGDTATLLKELSVSGPKTLIPEFHDCQRLIMENGAEYGPLVGIFAAASLNQFTVTPAQYATEVGVVAAGVATAGTVNTGTSDLVAFVEAVAWGDYPLLGIASGINCLYIVPDATHPTGLSAKMVNVQDEKECGRGVSAVRALKTTPLWVYPLAPEGQFKSDDYPDAARWDWDSHNQWWVIGVKCGSAWCIVGPKDSRVAQPHLPPTNAIGADKRRVFRIRGWYDEQRLAVNGSSGLLPGPQTVTVFPAHDLGVSTDVRDFESWKLVAEVQVLQHSGVYAGKLGFQKTGPGGPYNEVRLCQGSKCDVPVMTPPLNCLKDTDGNTWYAQITPPGGPPTYRCVNSHRHTGFNPPGTARWRWSLKDETLWTRCAEGCCEVTGFF